MGRIHQITHPNPLIARKVNYFADYFIFCAETIGHNDLVPIENPLSIFEKIIIQIEGKSKNCYFYIDGYLQNPVLDEKYLCDFNSFKDIKPLIDTYKKLTTKQKKKWISDTPIFLSSVKTFVEVLRKEMFVTALNEIKSILTCEHEITEHKDVLLNYTRWLVSEYFLSLRAKKELTSIFDKILSKDLLTFPFPIDLANEDDTAKQHFLDNRTFHQQFDGLHNSLKSPLKETYFVFRVSNLKANSEFQCAYHKVTFYSTKHLILTNLKQGLEVEPFVKDFFKEEFGLVAVIKSEYYSMETAYKEALSSVKQELMFVNAVLKTNGVVDPFTYILTADFNSISGFSGNTKKDGHEIKSNQLERLNDNPFYLLSKCEVTSKEKFLRHENLFIEAITTRNPATYWQYLEALIPDDDDGKNQILDFAPSILSLRAEFNHKEIILYPYVINSLNFFLSDAAYIGLTKEELIALFYETDTKFSDLNQRIKHPFLNDLMEEYLTTFTKEELIRRMEHYKRTLLETQSERNFYYHQGLKNEKAFILLDESLTRLVVRFRWIIIKGIEDNDGTKFDDIVLKLYNESKLLLN
jgi:hypothetical protein